MALSALLLALAACSRTPPVEHAASGIQQLDHADAAPADWHSSVPPDTGWVPVTLMDVWTSHWPTHDGVVWYRLRWNAASADTPMGLLLDYVCLADAVYLNGSLVHRDQALVEPLARSWVKPQYFLLDKPLLRQGENELLVRVSGLAAYQPGMGTVTVGDAQTVSALYQQGVHWRYDIPLFNQAIGVVLGALFGMFWLVRREDTVYGWYALSALLFAGYGFNFIAPSVWPFASTDGWEAFNAFLYAAAASSFAIFLLRYCHLKARGLTRTLLAFNAISLTYALLWPGSAGPQRSLIIIVGGLIYYSGIVAFIVNAVRTRRTDQRVLAVCLLIPLLTSLHDFLLFFGIIRSNLYVLAFTSPLTLIGMGFVLAHRFAAAMRRAEGFNVELQREVATATDNLSNTLAREHELALVNTRIGERLNLVRDVHDGFGGSLLSAIAALERSPVTSETLRTTAVLKQLRDDLRLIIDTTTTGPHTDLPGLLAPLRHRWSQRMEAAGIESQWHMEGIEQVRLEPARSLDLLRFLQEAMTNVLKHSGAGHVALTLRRTDARLLAEVQDNGCGFDETTHTQGVGLASLRARAERLGGAMHLRSRSGEGVAIALDVPLHIH
ncbi:ATP-binding protein [Dyella sp. C11]|uniref:sensor histidine kinase n=1 Tax=Dyella sp. C11 TaxID=2126991 RepID=UPI001300818C|nr:ATP-binding protein [Dyella sp. C11]